MKEANNIEEVFKNKLHDLETPVRADLWNNIAAQSGIQTGFWSASKIAGLGAAVLLVSAALWFGLSNAEQETPEQVAASPKLEMEIQEDIPNEFLENSESIEVVTEVQVVEKQAAPKRLTQDRSLVPTNTVKSSSAKPLEEIIQVNKPTEIQPAENIEPTALIESTVVSDKTENNQNASSSNREAIEASNETNVVKVNANAFEPAERLDLKVLIAPEKREEFSRESKHYPSAFPKIFNPNVSGDAAFFSIEVRDVSYFKVEIRNQKGQLVFRSQDPGFIWKGTTLDGAMAPEGTYLFLIESNDMNGQALKPQSGAVFLMR